MMRVGGPLLSFVPDPASLADADVPFRTAQRRVLSCNLCLVETSSPTGNRALRVLSDRPCCPFAAVEVVSACRHRLVVEVALAMVSGRHKQARDCVIARMSALMRRCASPGRLRCTVAGLCRSDRTARLRSCLATEPCRASQMHPICAISSAWCAVVSQPSYRFSDEATPSIRRISTFQRRLV